MLQRLEGQWKTALSWTFKTYCSFRVLYKNFGRIFEMTMDLLAFWLGTAYWPLSVYQFRHYILFLHYTLHPSLYRVLFIVRDHPAFISFPVKMTIKCKLFIFKEISLRRLAIKGQGCSLTSCSKMQGCGYYCFVSDEVEYSIISFNKINKIKV